MNKTTLLLLLLMISSQTGCGAGTDPEQDRDTRSYSAQSIQIALATAREWGFARAVNSCRRLQTYCEENRPDGIDCQGELLTSIETGERAFSPLLATGLKSDPGSPGDPIVPTEEILTTVQKKNDSDTKWDYGTCMSWCWSSHKYCKKHQSEEFNCGQHLGVCIEACESEFDPQFGGLDLVLGVGQLPVLECQH